MERSNPRTRRHARPLRTYSRRTQSDCSPERPVKKRRATSDGEKTFTDTNEDVLETPQIQPLLPAPSMPEHPKKKGLILDYFKVRSPQSDGAASCAATSDSTLPSSTSPSSPPPRDAPRRKRRRLATRPPGPTRDLETDDGDEHSRHSSDEKTRSTSRGPLPLQTTGGSALNCRETRPDFETCGAVKRRKSKATVQTTLSLSTTEKQFVECKDCEMLYNPFYEKDAKLHARRHAATLKKKGCVDSTE